MEKAQLEFANFDKAEEVEKKRAQSRERSKKYRDKKKAAEMVVETDETYPVETPDMAVFKSRMAKKRAVDKTRKVLPATPNKKLTWPKNFQLYDRLLVITIC